MIGIIALETLYLLLIVLMSVYIFLKIRAIYKFSSYRGVKYLYLSFLFFPLGFFLRYLIMLSKIFSGQLGTINSFGILSILMEFFLILPGMLIFYSLIWKSIEKSHYAKGQGALFLIYSLAIIFALGDWLLKWFYLMYSSQILLFVSASVISYSKYKKNKNNFLQLFFIGMVLFFIVWVFNLIAQLTIDSFPIMRLYAYIFTIAGFGILSYVVRRLTHEKKKRKA